MREIDKIIIHCSDTPEGREVTIEEIRRWHTKERGWSDIGYHFVIYLDGTVKVGRPIEKIGAHVAGHNKNSIGICYVGGRAKKTKKAKDTRTQEQKESLYNLLIGLMFDHSKATIHGHNEFSSKSCPSFDVQKEYKELIKAFKK